MPFVSYLHRVANRENLSADDARSAMGAILSGEVSTPLLAAFLVALRMKGETPDELLGFAEAMRAKAEPIPVALNGEALLDTCGTGGAQPVTFNISTVVAFVVAGAGVRVAKHGNRSNTSLCGSADILEGLGVKITLTGEQVAASIRTVGFGFLFAPTVHPAMRHAAAARSELKMRTVFNLLGPLTNPAGATAQLVGAPNLRTAELMAQALASLGLQRGFVVHGLDGLDEITTTGETVALEINRGVILHHNLTPEDFGVPRATVDDLAGGDRLGNCNVAEAILSGEAGPRRDIVLVNASAALVAAGQARDFHAGMGLASESIDSGAALKKMRDLVKFTQTI